MSYNDRDQTEDIIDAAHGFYPDQNGGWRDLVGPIESRGAGATRPTYRQIGSGPFWAYDFAINDEVWVYYHIDHDISPNTPIYLHTHWLPDGTDANSVKWQFTYSIALGHQQQVFDVTGTVVSVEQTPEGTAYMHHIAEISDNDAAAILASEPDALLLVNIKRIANGGTDNTDQIFLLLADCHYQADRFSTKNRAPNFYA